MVPGRRRGRLAGADALVTVPTLASSQAKRLVVILQVLAAGISIVGTILVLRKAGVEARGTLAGVLTIAVLVPAFSVLSLDFAIPWYIRCYGMSAELRILAVRASVLSAVASFALASALLSALPLRLNGWTIVATALGVGVAAPTLLRAGALRAVGYIWIDPVQGIVRAATTTIAAALTPSVSLLVSSVAASLILVWIVGELSEKVLGPTTMRTRSDAAMPHKGSKEEVVRYGLRMHFGTMAVLFSYRIDQLIILAASTTAVLGVYSTAVSVSEAVLLPVTALLPILFVEESRVEGATSTGLGPTSRKCIGYGLLAGGAMLLVRHRLAALLVTGQRIDDLAGCIAWMAGATMAVCAWRVVSLSAAARGRPSYRSVAAVPAIAVTIVGDLMVVRSFGAIGAAIVSLAAYVSGLGVVIALLVRNRTAPDV